MSKQAYETLIILLFSLAEEKLEDDYSYEIENLQFPKGDNKGISISQEVLLKVVVLKQKYLQHFILNERTARLARCKYFTRNVKQNNTLISQLYRPP